MIVPADGERIFQMVPPMVCPALNGVMVKPCAFPVKPQHVELDHTGIEKDVRSWAVQGWSETYVIIIVIYGYTRWIRAIKAPMMYAL